MISAAKSDSKRLRGRFNGMRAGLPESISSLTSVHEWDGVKRRPLLALLEAAVTEQQRSGVGHRGVSSRIPLDTRAFDLREKISDRINGLCVEHSVRMEDAPAASLVKLWHSLHAAYLRTGGSSEEAACEYVKLLAQHWVAEIEFLLSPPPALEITSGCPSCGERWVLSDDGERRPVLHVVLGAGSPSAECKACGSGWFGWGEISALAYSSGLDITRISEVIRATGVL